jgi:hypothetical protein
MVITIAITNCTPNEDKKLLLLLIAKLVPWSVATWLVSPICTHKNIDVS